jgi:hypothetical protein
LKPKLPRGARPSERRGYRDAPCRQIALELTDELELERPPRGHLADTDALPHVDPAVAQAGLDDSPRTQPSLEQSDAVLELDLLFSRVQVFGVLREVCFASGRSAQPHRTRAAMGSRHHLRDSRYGPPVAAT